MRVAFDLDDTLIPVGRRFATEAPSHRVLRHLTPERLRRGAGALLRDLAGEGHEVWVYTTSLRPLWMVRLLFRAYGVPLGGVVNQAVHARGERRASSGTAWPSKFPPGYGIDVLVDDSVGVEVEGQRHGFSVIRIAPSEPDWVRAVKDGVRLIGESRRGAP